MRRFQSEAFSGTVIEAGHSKGDLHGGRERRGTIPNQISINLRPAIVAERGRFGDWEADLVIGAGQKQALVTINEHTPRYSLFAHVPFKTAQAVSDTMNSLLTSFAASVHTLTTDNGKEFAQHERIAEELDADFFFAHPYAFWERGANENMNGLIRQCVITLLHFRLESASHKIDRFKRYQLLRSLFCYVHNFLCWFYWLISD